MSERPKELTVVRCKTAAGPPAGKKYIEYRDGKQKGLVFRVHAGGTRTWYCVYRVRHVPYPQRKRLGEFPEVSLAEARSLAAGVLKAAHAGEDPAHPPLSKTMSLKELLDEYFRRRPQRSEAERRRLVETDLKAWLARPMAEISRREIRARLEEVANRAPIVSNRILGVLRAVCNWAIRVDLLDSSPVAGLAPLAPERAKARVLSAAEIRAFWSLLEGMDAPVALALQLILCTGQRPGEVAGMAWREVDVDGRVWEIPAARSKNGAAHRVPLPDFAWEILCQCRLGLPEVFPTPLRRGGPLPRQALHQAVRRWIRGRNDRGREIRPVLAFEPFTPHDLRRTAATGMAAAGVDRLVISKVLNHAEGGVTGRYDRYRYDREKHQALAAWGERLRAIIEQREAVVVPLPARAP